MKRSAGLPLVASQALSKRTSELTELPEALGLTLVMRC